MNKKKLIILISIIITLALLVCVGVFAISGSKKAKIEDKLDLGEKYLAELEYEKALAAYKEVLKIDPKSVEAYLGMAEVYIAMGEYEEALEILEEGYDKTESSKIEKKIEEVEALIAQKGEGEDSIGANAESSSVQEEPEQDKVPVTVDIKGLAAAYSQFLASDCMRDYSAFSLFDVTGDGIPELLTEGGCMATYWQGQSWQMMCSVFKSEWYYNEITGLTGIYYTWYKFEGEELSTEERLFFYSVDTTQGENPEGWLDVSEEYTENIDLSQYTRIDIQAYDKEEHKDVAVMEESLREWFARHGSDYLAEEDISDEGLEESPE